MVDRRSDQPDYFLCPHCGAAVPIGSASCRECGSDAETGWSEDAHRWEVDLPTARGEDDDFDYDEFVAREFPDHVDPSGQRAVRRWVTGALVVIISLAFLLWSLSR